MEMNDNLRELIYSNSYERNSVEGLLLGGVICPTIKLYGYDTYLYGDGDNIASVILYMEKNHIKVWGVIDDEPKRSCVLNRIPVLKTEDLKKIGKPENIFVIMNEDYSSFNWERKPFRTFLKAVSFRLRERKKARGLAKFGVIHHYRLLNSERKEIDFCPDRTVGALEYYRDNIEKAEAVFGLLHDDISKKVMLEAIRARIQCGVYNLPQCDGQVKYFFGHTQSDGSYETIYRAADPEVWVNCGACIGDTIFLYYANHLSADRIYAFEGNKRLYKKLKNNLDALPGQYQSHVTPINEYIDENTDFKAILGDRKITLMNADIEGNEMALLKNMAAVIKKDRPVIAICLYHKIEDILSIPDYISSIVDDYSFIMRKYEARTGNISRVDELVLYAVPDERMP